MLFIPTHCDKCQVSTLVDAIQIVNGYATCSTCSDPARALPGGSYSPDDVPLFKNLEMVLSEARLSPFFAAQLVVVLEERTSKPGKGLKRIAGLQPSLSILELLVSDDPREVRKAEGMLCTLLEVIAASRSKSGIMPRFDAATAATAKRA